MSVRRVMGTETEYAVSDASASRYDPVALSFDVVRGASQEGSAHIRWDYRQEDPINDARGSRLDRAAARPEMLTDAPQLHITNVMAPNGGRIYVDHAHPEYSSPESTDPFRAVAYDLAGDALMRAAARKASRLTGKKIVLHRNNVDGKGASWGTHESYRNLRAVPFRTVSELMTIHFVSRQIYTGSGRVGIGERSEGAGYQLSQRADYIHTGIGLQTTFDRPIINTRDESHDRDDYRRLHVIVGDANRMQVPQILKLGTTSMLLWLAEQSEVANYDLRPLLDELEVADPVAALHQVSHDCSLRETLPMKSGARLSAVQLQQRLYEAVDLVGARIYGTDGQGADEQGVGGRGTVAWPDAPTRRIMAMWRCALADVARISTSDEDARLALVEEASRIEWLRKWQVLEQLRRRYLQASGRSGNDAGPSSWSDPRLRACDLSWASLQEGASVYDKLSAGSACPISDDCIARACDEAPEDTRAWLRAQLLSRFPQELVAMSWSSITVRDADPAEDHVDGVGILSHQASGTSTAVLSVGIPDPLRCGKADAEEALRASRHAADVLRCCESRLHA
ncbi:depupylase/deamidase Dop [Bifidobacterium psychraerophilum]|uniref:depupylase/deamidase Dop n=1 Tax=Bifidobacterium psychraerophilum TaxID=218140 RepID=UPI003114FEDB